MAAAAGFDHLLGELECPVCLLIPREGPVQACPAGHIVCKKCRELVDHSCPTCRRPMTRDGTNTIVNKMIEKIHHSCKYKEFGCKIKQHLNELVDHEAKCHERTIKCPYLRCNMEVQIKKFYDHAFNSKCCFRDISINGECHITFSIKSENLHRQIFRDAYWSMKGFEKSGRGNHVGDVRLRQLRVDTTERGRRWTCVECQRYFVSDDSLQKHLQEDHKFPGQTNDKIFYLHSYFFSTESTFAFYVTGEAEPDNLAKITLKNSNDERRFLTSVQGVVSMDSALKDKNEVLASRNVMFVSWRQMSGFLQWSEKDGIQYSKIQATVEIITE